MSAKSSETVDQELNAAEARKLNDLIRILELAQTEQDKMLIQQLHLFFLIAMNPNRSQVEYREAARLSVAGIGRNIAALGGHERFNRPGMGLIRVEQDAHDLRVNRVSLSAKGVRFLKKLLGNS